MSKRFGRNQKRKLKKEIEELKNTIELGRGLYNRAMKENDVLSLRVQRLDQSAKDVASILGKNFAGLNANDVIIDSKLLPRIFQAVVPDRYDNFLDYIMSEDATNATARFLELPVMTGEVYRTLASDMHFVLESSIGSVGYAISEETLKRLPTDVLVDKVSRILSQKLKYLVK